MAKSNPTDLVRIGAALQSERAELAARIAEIDQAFSDLGMAPSGAPAAAPVLATSSPVAAPAKRKYTKRTDKPRGKPGPKPGSRRTRSRGKFTISGDDSVVSFVKAHPGCSTKQVNDHWIAEGRKGKADNALGKLVKSGRLKRTQNPEGRGSVYK